MSFFKKFLKRKEKDLLKPTKQKKLTMMQEIQNEIDNLEKKDFKRAIQMYGPDFLYGMSNAVADYYNLKGKKRNDAMYSIRKAIDKQRDYVFNTKVAKAAKGISREGRMSSVYDEGNEGLEPGDEDQEEGGNPEQYIWKQPFPSSDKRECK